MRATAELHRVPVERIWRSADLQNAHRVAVFFSEELDDVFSLPYLSIRNLCPRHGRIFRNLFVHQFLYVADLLLRQCRAREIERQFVRSDIAALL